MVAGREGALTAGFLAGVALCFLSLGGLTVIFEVETDPVEASIELELLECGPLEGSAAEPEDEVAVEAEKKKKKTRKARRLNLN